MTDLDRHFIAYYYIALTRNQTSYLNSSKQALNRLSTLSPP